MRRIRNRTRNEPWPRPHDSRRIDGTRYRLVLISFSDDEWGRKLSLEYVEEKSYIAANAIPRAPWWRRLAAAVKRDRTNEAAPEP